MQRTKAQLSVALLPNQVSPPCRTDRVLGSGSQATIYRGTFQKQPAALKVFFQKADSDQEKEPSSKSITEYQIEKAVVKNLAPLQHPHIVQFFGETQFKGNLALAFEVLEKDLAASLETHDPYTAHQRLTQLEGVVDAICFLHKQGWLYRDIKPSNVMLTVQGRSKLTDFGHTVGLGKPVVLLETCYYMAPELVKPPYPGNPSDNSPCACFDAASDSYGLGYLSAVIFYEMPTLSLTWGMPWENEIVGIERVWAGGWLDPNMRALVPNIVSPESFPVKGAFAGHGNLVKTMKAKLIAPAMRIAPEARIAPDAFSTELKGMKGWFFADL